MKCNCNKNLKTDEILYTDPFNNMKHTKNCILSEIKYLKDAFSLDEIHSSGISIKKRIIQLEKLIFCKQEWIDVQTIAHQIIKTPEKTIVDMSHICKLEKGHTGQCICTCGLCINKTGSE